MKPKLLTPYEKAEIWSRIHIVTDGLEKSSQRQNYAECSNAIGELRESLDKIAAHNAAETIERGKNKK